MVLFVGVTLPPDPITIITELCDGGSLYNYLRKSTIDISKKLELMLDIAKGMVEFKGN